MWFRCCTPGGSRAQQNRSVIFAIHSFPYVELQLKALVVHLSSRFDSFLIYLHLANRPLQLIHGDLHYDNVMVVGDSVSGVLDFEFCAYDWRAMELAVALSKWVLAHLRGSSGNKQPVCVHVRMM